jgi:DNA recombination protein RmuC
MLTGILIAIITGSIVAAAAYIIIMRKSVGATSDSDPRLSAVKAVLTEKENRLRELESEKAAAHSTIESLRAELSQSKSNIAALEEKLRAEEKLSAEKLQLLKDAKTALSDAFGALAGQALHNNTEQFLALAKGELGKEREGINSLVNPLQTSLKNLDEKIASMESKREGAYEGLRTHIEGLLTISQNWQKETAALTHALKTPGIRGRWGEIQLRRLVELAGMQDHVDFTEQTSKDTDDGKLRPDMLIYMPNGRTIVVDSKCPFDSYFTAIETEDEANKSSYLERHVSTVRGHYKKLSSKAYNAQFDTSPDFTVLFMNLESAFSAALMADPALIEDAVNEGIIIATPTTLLALLKAVAYGWQHERLAKNAEDVRRLGRDLYTKVSTFVDHYEKLGRAVTSVVTHYNNATGSLESRVLSSVRRFTDLGIQAENGIAEIEMIDKVPRLIAKEILPADHSKDKLFDS